MFGYVRPNIPELRVREKTRYEAWYCGLCGCIGRRYGLAARACLSYDCAFLAMLLHSVCAEEPIVCSMHTCTFKPLGRKRPMLDGTSPALEYAAAVCVILGAYKLDDNVRDGKPLYAAAKLPLRHAFSTARRDFPGMAEAVETALAKLARIEAANDPSLDSAADAFGKLLRDLLSFSPAPKEAIPALSELGFHLGRYIYLLDAWDDRAEDERHGNYNPFVIMGTSRERAEFLVNFSINSAILAYDLLELRCERELVGNIITQGCFTVADRIFSKESAGKK